MRTTESDNYHTWNTDGTYTRQWKYGKEIWCNLEGRYTHFIADYQ